MEFVILFFAWGIPLAAFVFVVSALWQLLKAAGSINAELIRIRELLEQNRSGG